jgi:hypothetical protein
MANDLPMVSDLLIAGDLPKASDLPMAMWFTLITSDLLKARDSLIPDLQMNIELQYHVQLIVDDT